MQWINLKDKAPEINKEVIVRYKTKEKSNTEIHFYSFDEQEADYWVLNHHFVEWLDESQLELQKGWADDMEIVGHLRNCISSVGVLWGHSTLSILQDGFNDYLEKNKDLLQDIENRLNKK